MNSMKFNLSFLCCRGGKHRRYVNWENLKEFLKKQNDDSFDYEQKAKDLIVKYTQHHQDLREKGEKFQ